MIQAPPSPSTPIPFDLAVFPATEDSADFPTSLDFAPGSN
jgi:hypothetical protein